MSLRDEINALPAALLASRDNNAIAAAVSVGRVKIVDAEIGKGKIIETLGLTAGNTLLDAIDSDANYRHIKQLVANGWLNIGSALARSALDALVPAALTATDAAKLKALAEQPDPVTEFDVRCAMYDPKTGAWIGV